MTLWRQKRLGRAAWFAVVLLCPGEGVAGPLVAAAVSRPDRSSEAYVIPPGNEQRLLRLLRPYSLTNAAPDSWRLAGVRLQGGTVRLQLAGPKGGRATVLLQHTEMAPGAERTLSFSVRRLEQRGEQAPAAVGRLILAIRRNDDGTWAREVWTPSREAPRLPYPATTVLSLRVSDRGWAQGWLQGICLALLALALLLAVRGRRGAPWRSTLRLPRGASLPWLAFYAGLTGAVWLLLWWIAPSAPLCEDTVRDLLAGRDCQRGDCGAGAVSGLLQLRHPLGWYHFVALMLDMGIPIEHVHLAACGLHACAVTLMLWTARRVLDPGAAALATALFASVVLSAVRFPLLWHPSGLPLGIALCAMGLVGVTRDPRWRWSLILASGVAVCVEAHPTGWLLLVLFLVVLLAVSHHRWRDGLGYLGIAFGIPVTLSWAPLRANFSALSGQIYLTPAVVGMLIAVVGGVLALKYRLRCLDGRRRQLEWLLFFAGLYLVVMLVGRGGFGYPVAGRHLTPLALPLALLGAWAAVWIMDRLGFSSRQRWACHAGAILAMVFSTGLRVRAPRGDGLLPGRGDVRAPHYTLVEVARLRQHLHGRGWRRGEVLRYLRGPRSQDLSAGLALWAREPTMPLARDRKDLRVIRVDLTRVPSTLPPGWWRLSLGGQTVALLGAFRPWVRLIELSWCRRPARDSTARCQKLDAKHWRGFGGPARFVRFAQGQLAVLRGALRGGYTLRIPIEVQGPDRVRTLELLPQRRQEASARWRIAALEGVSGVVGKAGQCVSMTPRPGERRGTLVLRLVPAPAALLRLPQVFESRPPERSLRRLLRRRGEHDAAACGR